MMYMHDRCSTYEVTLNGSPISVDAVAEALYNPLMCNKESSALVINHAVREAIVNVCRAYYRFVQREVPSEKLSAFYDIVESKTSPMSHCLCSLLVKQSGGEKLFLDVINSAVETADIKVELVFPESYDSYLFYSKHKDLILTYLDKVSVIMDCNGVDLHNGIVDFVTTHVLKNNCHQDQVADGLFSAEKDKTTPNNNNLLISHAVMKYCFIQLCSEYKKFEKKPKESDGEK